MRKGSTAMATSFSHPDTSSALGSAVENGWYLLRRNIFLDNRIYKAGTLVEHIDGEWFLQEKREGAITLDLTSQMMCRTYYHGVSLYLMECTWTGTLYARPALSEMPSVKVDPMVAQISLQNGESRVCVKFGHCFLPLELFNW